MEDALRQRIKEVLLSKGITANKFSNGDSTLQTRLSRQLNQGASVTFQTISAILTRFDDVSAEWLLRGKGEMLIKEEVEYDGSFADMDKYKVLKSKYEQLREDYESLLFAISGNARGKASSASA